MGTSEQRHVTGLEQRQVRDDELDRVVTGERDDRAFRQREFVATFVDTGRQLLERQRSPTGDERDAAGFTRAGQEHAGQRGGVGCGTHRA